jgi:hypothetical protein
MKEIDEQIEKEMEKGIIPNPLDAAQQNFDMQQNSNALGDIPQEPTITKQQTGVELTGQQGEI